MTVVNEAEQFSSELDENEEYVDVNAEQEEEEQETLEASEDEEESGLNIPEKFKGKSVEDIVKSYQELEKAYGQRANDLGEYRKLTDQLLEQQLQSKKQVETEEDNFDIDDLLENPKEAVTKAVKKATQPLEDKLLSYEREKRQEKFVAKHPDFQQVVNSPEFGEWVMASPVRQKLFQEADKNYDYDVASELLDTYKALNSRTEANVEEQKEVVQKKRAKAMKQATTETAARSAPSSKVFSRKQLIHLKMTNPAKYESLRPEINLAYAEGRIKD